MTYLAAEGRYDTMSYRRCGRSGLRLPGLSLGLWHNFGGVDVFETWSFHRASRLRPGCDALRPRQQLRTAARLRRGDLRPHPGPRPAPLPRRTDHLHQGGLRDVAGPLRRLGLTQVPAREPRAEPAPHAPRLRRHLLLAPPRSRDADRGDDGRLDARSDRARPCTPASRTIRRSRPAEAVGSCVAWARRASSTSPATRSSTVRSKAA